MDYFKRKTSTRVVAMLFAFLMVVNVLPFNAFAEGGNCGTIVLTLTTDGSTKVPTADLATFSCKYTLSISGILDTEKTATIDADNATVSIDLTDHALSENIKIEYTIEDSTGKYDTVSATGDNALAILMEGQTAKLTFKENVPGATLTFKDNQNEDTKITTTNKVIAVEFIAEEIANPGIPDSSKETYAITDGKVIIPYTSDFIDKIDSSSYKTTIKYTVNSIEGYQAYAGGDNGTNSKTIEITTDNMYNLSETIELSQKAATLSLPDNVTAVVGEATKVDGDLINYSDTLTFTVTPDSGKNIKSFKINDVEKSVDEDGNFTVAAKDIWPTTGNSIVVSVEFEDIVHENNLWVIKSSEEDLDKYVSKSYDNTYILKNDKSATLKIGPDTTKGPIGSSTKWSKISSTGEKRSFSSEISLSSLAKGSSLYVSYGNSPYYKQTPTDAPIIVKDTTAPTVSLDVKVNGASCKSIGSTFYASGASTMIISAVDVLNIDGDEKSYSNIDNIKYSIAYKVSEIPAEKTEPEDVDKTTGDTITSDDDAKDGNKFTTASIEIPESSNGKCVITITATDVAGNTSEAKTFTVITNKNATDPTITVESNANAKGYVTTGNATVTIKVDDPNFNVEETGYGQLIMNNLIKITETDEDGNSSDVTNDYTVTFNDYDSDGIWESNDITFTKDTAKYKVEVGNEQASYSSIYNKTASNTSKELIIDRTKPTIADDAVSIKEVEPETVLGEVIDWVKTAVGSLFGVSTNKDVEIVVDTNEITDNWSATDNLSITYFVDKSGVVLEESVLADKEFGTLEAANTELNSSNSKAIVYVKIVDEAGNVTYASSEGIIIDKVAPTIDEFEPVVTLDPEQPINGLYNDDVKVDVTVVDPGDVYSGVKEIKYEVYVDYDENDDSQEPTQKDSLYTYDKDADATLINKLSSKSADGYEPIEQITVDAEKNNSNNVTVIVTVTDNAGNTTSESIDLSIDTTAPVVEVTYGEDDPTPSNDKYYNETRTATITVTERNFDEDAVVVKVTKDGKDISNTISLDWKEVKFTAKETKELAPNGDDTQYYATIEFADDGDYTLKVVSVADLAGNKASEITYDGKNTQKFTIDKTLPVVSVSYDNNSAENKMYFKADRTATITIVEHNFDVDLVEFTQTAELDGKSIKIPAAKWTNNGDTHTAVIKYTADGDYTFDVAVTDLAANEAAEADYGKTVAGKEFTVDKTIVKPTISIAGTSANGTSYKDKVVPSITITDVNFDKAEVKLVRQVNGKVEDVTAKFLQNSTFGAQGGTITNDTFEKIQDNDGIYTLTVTFTDKAGNSETETKTFTVNRFGSVYVFNDALINIQDTYVQNVGSDLVITEYNPDKLVNGSAKVQITRDGSPISNVDKYVTITPATFSAATTGESGWYQFVYTINKDAFKDEGVYKIVISSEDEAGNSPQTANYEDCAIIFRVDRTAPEFTSIIGLDKTIVNSESLDVKYQVFDAIGLAKIEVYVAGELVVTVDKFEDLANYEGTFTIGEGSNQSVRLVAYDLAGNSFDTNDYEEAPAFEFNDSVTVSTNFFVRWFANKLIFFGSLALIVAAIVLIVVVLKRKKSEKADTAAK